MSERRRRRPGAMEGVLAGAALVSGWLLARAWRPTAPAYPSDRAVPPAGAAGEAGVDGYHAVWDRASPDAPVSRHIQFQYAGMAHQADTAIAGMWLFLATELLFFGGLFFLYIVYRASNQAAFAEASRHAELGIGTVNTVLLLASSAIFAFGHGCAARGRNRALFWTCVATALLGAAFIALKGYEWSEDFRHHLFPGPDFAIGGALGPSAQLFWCFYFFATALHGLHMIIGITLVGWIGWGAHRGRFSAGYSTPVEAVGLYWSFVDVVWLLLYPMIYLAGGTG
jgi:cytochrome c oxidase subunit 3